MEPGDPTPNIIMTDVPVPPVFEEAFGYDGCRRLFAVYWSASGELAWEDGERSPAGADYMAWFAIMHHPAYRFLAGHFHFGDPDEEGTHILVVDRKARYILVVEREDAEKILVHSNEPMGPAFRRPMILTPDDVAVERAGSSPAIERLCGWIREEMFRIARDMDAASMAGHSLARCVNCGCTDGNACVTADGPCGWVWVDRKSGRGLCSNCQGRGHTPASDQPLIIIPGG